MIQLGILGTGEIIVVSLAVIFVALLPLIALIDILKSKFEGNNKLIWVIVVLFLSFLGAILYYFIGRKQKIGEKGQE